MAIATFKAAVASTLTLSPYIVNTEAFKKSESAKSTWFPVLSQGTIQAVRVTALVLAIISTVGFATALIVPTLAIPVITLGSAALLTASICLLVYAIFVNQKKGTTAEEDATEAKKPQGPESIDFLVLVKEKTKGKQKTLKEHDPINVAYYKEDEVRLSKSHRVVRITAVALVVLAALATAAAAIVTSFAIAPILPWAPLIALGGSVAFAIGVSTFALSVLSVYTKQRIPTDKNRFELNTTGAVMADHVIDSTTLLKDSKAKSENVYMTRGEYKKYLLAQDLLARNVQAQGAGGIL